MDEREMIERRLVAVGLTADEWDPNSENGLTARFTNTWTPTDEDESRGLYEGDEGKLSVCVVGSGEYGNQRVMFTFTPEGNDPDSGEEVTPFEDVEPL